MHGFQGLPPACVPANWNPRIDTLLSDVWVLLTPAQRDAYRIWDIKEKWGGLRIAWSVEAEVSSDVVERIDALIAQASNDLQSPRGA